MSEIEGDQEERQSGGVGRRNEGELERELQEHKNQLHLSFTTATREEYELLSIGQSKSEITQLEVREMGMTPDLQREASVTVSSSLKTVSAAVRESVRAAVRESVRESGNPLVQEQVTDGLAGKEVGEGQEIEVDLEVSSRRSPVVTTSADQVCIGSRSTTQVVPVGTGDTFDGNRESTSDLNAGDPGLGSIGTQLNEDEVEEEEEVEEDVEEEEEEEVEELGQPNEKWYEGAPHPPVTQHNQNLAIL